MTALYMNIDKNSNPLGGFDLPDENVCFHVSLVPDSDPAKDKSEAVITIPNKGLKNILVNVISGAAIVSAKKITLAGSGVVENGKYIALQSGFNFNLDQLDVSNEIHLKALSTCYVDVLFYD